MATSSNFSTSNQYIKYRIVVTENSTSIPNNTSSITVKVDAWRTNSGYTTSGSGTCYCTINGTKYSQSISSSQSITYNSHTVLFNKTVTIPHNADGSKTVSVSAYIDHSRFSSNAQGFNVTLTTIPRQANITAAPDFYDTDNPTITYSNPAGDIAAITSLQACISLTGAEADVPYRNISKTGTSYTFNLTQAERNTLLAATPNSNTLSVRFIVRTVLSGKTYYSTVIKTMTVKNANPTITGASYQDTNATTTAITQNNQQIIQGQSTVSFNFSSLAALKYATLTKIEITVNAVTVSSNLSGSSVSNKTVSFGTIDSSSNLAASIKLTDSRGNTTTQSLNIIMLGWILPTAIISLSRKSNYYDETYIKVNADYSSLDSKNTITIQYQYKEVGGSTWSSLATLQDDVQATISLDNTKAFDFKIFVTDRIGSTTYNAVLQIGIPIMFIDRLLRSVGIGTIPDQSNMLAVDRRIQLKNTLQETVADLWTSNVSSSTRSANLIFYNKDGQTVATLSGASRLLSLNDTSGNRRALLWTSNGYGVFQLWNANGDEVISAAADTGNITCVSLTQTSSRKVKDNIAVMDPAEARKILELVAVTFDFKDKEQGTDKRGFIAEDVAEVIPELVTPETEDNPARLDYIEIIPYLQAVIKEQDKRIKDLEDKIEELSKKLT